VFKCAGNYFPFGALITRMVFEMRKKRKYKGAENFVTKIREIQKEAKVTLEKAQKEIKKYIDRKRAEVDEYKVGNVIMLSIKDLKYQIIGKRTEKLTKRFIRPYKIKKVVSSNIVKLELLATIKIYLVVNVSRIQRYIGYIKEQKRKQPALVIIERKKEQEIERILSKQQMRGKNKYLV